MDALRRDGWNVALISSGISCTVYDNAQIQARTVHSQYALQTADLPWHLVVSRAAPKVKQSIENVDTVIWDKIAMSSARIFELVNVIHNKVSVSEHKSKPFGGKQIIIVGDFLQLRPIPNLFDNGRFSFQSRIFSAAICQRFQLSKILRQDRADPRFISALQELRLGNCSRENELFLKSLDRPLPPKLATTQAVHIYFQKMAVQLHNYDVLTKLHGDMIGPFDWNDVGNVRNFICPAESKLLLKLQCRVILVWNLNEQLKNGSSGTLIGFGKDSMTVEFDSVRQCQVKKQTWFKRDRNGVVGCRIQFPLVLFYAATCHKTQGLTLPPAVVHCSQEFVSGLTYVSVTRVRHDNNIQVCNFQERFLLRPLQDAVNISKPNAEGDVPIDNFCCCHSQVLPKDYFLVTDDGLEDEDVSSNDDDHLDDHADQMECNADGMVQSYFERDEDEVVLDLANALLTIETEMSQVNPPDDISDRVILNEIDHGTQPTLWPLKLVQSSMI